MADDDNDSYYGGSAAGGLVGAAAGFGLIAGAPSIIGALGVHAISAPAVLGGGMMSVATIISAPVAIAAGAAILLAGAVIGAIAGREIHKYRHRKAHERLEQQRATSYTSMSAYAPDLAPEQAVHTENNWTKIVQEKKGAANSGPGIGAA